MGLPFYGLALQLWRTLEQRECNELPYFSQENAVINVRFAIRGRHVFLPGKDIQKDVLCICFEVIFLVTVVLGKWSRITVN